MDSINRLPLLFVLLDGVGRRGSGSEQKLAGQIHSSDLARDRGSGLLRI